MKIILVLGARPNFMKIAPIWQALCKEPDVFEPVLVHTEQHYDDRMSEVFIRELNLPEPHHRLGVGSGSQAVMTAKVMTAFEPVLLAEEPDLVVVVGDVNASVACALVSAKLHVPVAHVEAGLRSRDRSMPEEINRIVTDTLSDLLLTPSEDANENLIREGVPEEKIHFVGNVMIDSLRLLEQKADASPILETLGVMSGEYALVTAHRVSNVDDRETLSGILLALDRIQNRIQMVWPLHPRTGNRIEQFGFQDRVDRMEGLKIIDPVGYLDVLKLQKNARMVLTDSGGIQEETTAFGVPCLTMRENTERPVTIEVGTNSLVGVGPERIVAEAEAVLAGDYRTGCVPEFWDGGTAERIAGVFRACSGRT